MPLNHKLLNGGFFVAGIVPPPGGCQLKRWLPLCRWHFPTGVHSGYVERTEVQLRLYFVKSIFVF